LLTTLGLTDTQHLDIEGLTATARGGLLLGLKEPLDERGEAVIWHLPGPDALLSGGTAAEAGLSASAPSRCASAPTASTRPAASPTCSSCPTARS
jgi:hypothetical protein